jgi:hypothetical protein
MYSEYIKENIIKRMKGKGLRFFYLFAGVWEKQETP